MPQAVAAALLLTIIAGSVPASSPSITRACALRDRRRRIREASVVWRSTPTIASTSLTATAGTVTRLDAGVSRILARRLERPGGHRDRRLWVASSWPRSGPVAWSGSTRRSDADRSGDQAAALAGERRRNALHLGPAADAVAPIRSPTTNPPSPRRSWHSIPTAPSPSSPMASTICRVWPCATASCMRSRPAYAELHREDGVVYRIPVRPDGRAGPIVPLTFRARLRAADRA